MVRKVGTPGADNFSGGPGRDGMFGAAGADTLSGLGGRDRLLGGVGGDRLDGGADADILYDNDGYVVTLNPIVDRDTDTMLGGAGDDLIHGGNQDRFDGGAGFDEAVIVFNSVRSFTLDFTRLSPTATLALPGGGSLIGIERISVVGARGADRITGSRNADILDGDDGGDVLKGGRGADALFGKDGADTLDGGQGADRLFGGNGDDTYYVDAADFVSETNLAGTDHVIAGFSYQLAVFFENLTLTGTRDINGAGNGANNRIIGNSGRNELTGEAGADWLDGGAGADIMRGGANADTYFVDNAGDQVIEAEEAGGPDEVFSLISYTLTDNVENLTLQFLAATGTGNALNNTITGNNAGNSLFGLGGDDTLNGAGGADAMNGGAGNDIYVVDSAGDTVIDDAGEPGIDEVRALVNFTLGDGLDNLSLSGATVGRTGVGNDLANIMGGSNHNDILLGLAGNDELSGANGSDQIEGGDDDDVLLGGAGADDLDGGEGNDWLDGGEGAADTMAGGAGHDTYVVWEALDSVSEGAGGGTDTVRSHIDHVLGAEIENLVLLGQDGTGAGNELANVLELKFVRGTLNGLGGDDRLITDTADAATLTGGSGADTFVLRWLFVSSSTHHVITDFAVGEDTIELPQSRFPSLPLGALSPDNFRILGTPSDDDDYLSYNPSSGDLYYDADPSTPGAPPYRIATLSPGLALTADDFVLV
jgi:Ca2+-binding RTX toxin-like protein